MQERILFVDDDTNVLTTYQRLLRKQFQVDTAAGPFEGLMAMDSRGPFAEIEADVEQRPHAMEILRNRRGWYDPTVLAAAVTRFAQVAAVDTGGARPVRSITTGELRVGQMLLSNVETKDGLLLLSGGNKLTGASLIRTRNFAKLVGIKEPILIESEEAAEE